MNRKDHLRWRRLPDPPKRARTRHRESWSAEDDELLRELYTSSGGEYAAAALGRTILAVRLRAAKLHIPSFDARRLEDVAEQEVKRRRRKGDDIVDERFVPTGAIREAILQMIGRREIDDIASQYHTTPATIRAIAREHGHIPRPASEQWSAKEDRELRKLWQTDAPRLIARSLGRSVYAVKQRVAQLGIVRSRKKWSKEDLDFVRDNYATMPIGEMAKVLGRTAAAVNKYRNRLVPESRRPMSKLWTKREDALLRKLYASGADTATMAERIGRTVPAILQHAQALGITARTYLPWEDDVLRAQWGVVSNLEIARQLDRSIGSVAVRLKFLRGRDANILREQKGNRQVDASIRKLYSTMTNAQLADELGMTRYELSVHLKRLALGEKSHHDWSAADERYLRTHFATKPLSEIAAHIGATEMALSKRARNLGLERANRVRAWTEAEDAYMRMHYATGDKDSIAAHLGRTRQGIRQRAKKLKLTRRV